MFARNSLSRLSFVKTGLSGRLRSELHTFTVQGHRNHVNKINLEEKFGLFSETWSPRVVAELNGQLVKLAKVEGEFDWHHHDVEDELFLVVKGSLTIKLRDRDIELQEGEFFVVPKGVEHKPVATSEAHILLFEPASTLNTGTERTNRTKEVLPWI